MSGSLMIYLLVALVPICGVLYAIVPRLMPRNEFFTVTIPEDKTCDPRLCAMRRRYSIIVLVCTVIETVIAAWCASSLLEKHLSETMFLVVYIVLFLVMIPVTFALMLVYRKKARALKQQEGWQAETQERTALITQGTLDRAPRPLSLAWNLLYVPVILFCAGLALYLYPLMPDQIPMQTNLAGEVTRYTQKSLLSALFPVWINLFMVVCFVFSHWSINKQKPPIDPKKPATSAYAFGAYRRAMAIMMLVDGIVLCLCIGITVPLTSVGILKMMQGAMIVMVAAVVIVVSCIILALVYGQNGSRLFKNASASSGMSRDDDKYWKAGIFYVNPNDPSIFVSKRFGVGTTVNFGSKAAWAVIVGFFAVMALFIVFCSGI